MSRIFFWGIASYAEASLYQLIFLEKYISKLTMRKSPRLPNSNEKSCWRMITNMNA
jgi:hypothetical protein